MCLCEFYYNMFSALYYIFLAIICTTFMVVSFVALIICYPFDKARRVVHQLSRIMVRIFFFVPPMWRHKIVGLQGVDPSRSYVIVINHNAMIDIPTLYYLPLNFRWVSKREVFKIPFFGQFLHLHGDIAIERGGSSAMDDVISKGKVWLSRGASVAIFPEGTRSKTGEINRFKGGAFLLAQQAGVEILPVVLDGTKTLIKGNRMFNWTNKIRIKVLPPVSVEHVTQTPVKELMAEVHDSMCAALAELRNEQ